MTTNARADLHLRPSAWSATLSSRQRVLLHAQPILALRQNWGSRDDLEGIYDPLCLSLRVFDVVIDQSGFGNEVVRQTIADSLLPLLASVDTVAGTPTNRSRHERVLDRLLNGLMNEANHGQSFQLEYCDVDETGRPKRKMCVFKLLKEVHGYSGEIVLQLSSEAINLFLQALDLDIESEQIANEAVVEYQLARGKYDKARASAENARGQSLRYEEKIESLIEQTKRDIRQVKWRDEVHGILVDALQHVQQRLKIEDGIIRSAVDKMDAMDESDDKRSVVGAIVQLMKDCRYRHLNLNRMLMSARSEFLDQQARQCFVDVQAEEVINLRDDVLTRLLGLRVDDFLTLGNVHTWLAPAAPSVLSLKDLVRWQLQPRRAYTPGETSMEALELCETDCDQQRFDDEVLRNAAKAFVGLDQRSTLSHLLATLEADGCPCAVQDAVTLEVLEMFDPDEEADNLTIDVSRTVGLKFTTSRCEGDDLWIEVREDA